MRSLTPTHRAYAFKRTGKKHGRLYECGTARIEADTNLIHVYLDRVPLGGWTGYLMVRPKDSPPPSKLEVDLLDEDEEDPTAH
jgi:hypothetical protein